MSEFIFNPWKELGVHRGTEPEDIKDAFRTLAQTNHPDRPTGNLEKFRRVTDAYAILRNTEKREHHLRVIGDLGAPCAKCSARGYLRKQISFTHFNVRGCADCDGCGYTERKRRVRTP
jgi:DnaJ-class molecular chaperone